MKNPLKKSSLQTQAKRKKSSGNFLKRSWKAMKALDTAAYQTGLTTMKILPRENVPLEIKEQVKEAVHSVNRDRRTQPPAAPKRTNRITARRIVEAAPEKIHSTVRLINSISNAFGKGDII